MNRKEWFEMINQELDDLKRISDRKASQESIKPFQSYPKRGKKNRKQVNFMPKPQIIEKPSSSITHQFLNYTFGIDIKEDFTNLFSIFGRVAKAKLDNIVLSEFASHEYVDILFSRASNNFSTQLTTNTEMYFSQINTRMDILEKKFGNFQHNINILLTQLENRIFDVKSQMMKLKNRHQIEIVQPHSNKLNHMKSSSQLSLIKNSPAISLSSNKFIIKAHGLDEDSNLSELPLSTPRKKD